MTFLRTLPVSLLALGLVACSEPAEPPVPPAAEPTTESTTDASTRPPDALAGNGPELLVDRDRLGIYHPVELTADLSGLSDDQREMLRRLIEAGLLMERLFWRQAFGDPTPLREAIDDPELLRFVDLNFGPWDRLNGNAPFLAGYGPKPPGARFYPDDMTREEYAAWNEPNKDDPYSLVRRDEAGELVLVPYHQAFPVELGRAAVLLRQAAALAESEAFATYLALRADALLTGDYRPSDMAWMDVRDNDIELVFGPIENYEDQLFGIRTAFEAFVLIKDRAWSERLSRYAELLPALQRGLPVDEAYKAEQPGTDADLNAYDAIFYAGDANAGAKTIAINLPNDEAVQLEKGTRRLQLKNTMRAKFDHILVPIAELLIDERQLPNITFDAFFANVMFHEVAHGLGIKFTIDDGRPVRAALAEHQSAIEEGKADILGLDMIEQLVAMEEWDGELMDHYVTFLAGIFRSVRFGASSAHGRANMVAFNWFREAGAFRRDADTGRYTVDRAAFEQAVNGLSNRILTLQGDGDYEATGAFLERYAVMPEQLAADLARAEASGIPVDIRLIQGPDLVGL
ncbi:Zn-dependent hydrolase [Wenzhouxiangella sp. XN79A]|uniref:dipeptidyl-peptidase 3 family protein n=1 Tax=Wenzhouxiangella sp. XN79A TaxID=2724193 RepID=UPI00144A8191|nr:Zn-dependent hydrolase [Wenzhouxiangella sp. XN79A]NKI34962.1 Zn-dependent hydrolase [Wenzhouxiangella sp. XN79A]